MPSNAFGDWLRTFCCRLFLFMMPYWKLWLRRADMEYASEPIDESNFSAQWFMVFCKSIEPTRQFNRASNSRCSSDSHLSVLSTNTDWLQAIDLISPMSSRHQFFSIFFFTFDFIGKRNCISGSTFIDCEHSLKVKKRNTFTFAFHLVLFAHFLSSHHIVSAVALFFFRFGLTSLSFWSILVFVI